jgi:hypothetical protein
MPLALECSRSLIADDAAWLQPPALGGGAGSLNRQAAPREGPTDDEVASTVETRKIWKRVRKHAAQGAGSEGTAVFSTLSLAVFWGSGR